MQIVIKAEDGMIYFNPQSIEFVENRTTCDGKQVSTIILEYPNRRVAVSDNYPLEVVKAVVNDIYESIEVDYVDVLRVHDDIWKSDAAVFDIKGLIDKFNEQEE